MEQSAIALLDTLGYKGIWSRAQPEDVLTSLETITSTAEKTGNNAIQNFAKRLVEGVPLTDYLPLQVWLRAFSDTIVVGCSAAIAPQCPSTRRRAIEILAPGVAIQVVCEMVAAIASTSAAQPTPLAYRGAIAFGNLAHRSSFLIGPAIDEAAEMEHQPEGAFVVVCPSASAFISSERRDLPLLYDYPVPCKNGPSRMHVVNPTCYTLDATKYAGSILNTFAGDESVARKRANTETLLLAAAKDSVAVERRASMFSQLKRMIEDATAEALARVREIGQQQRADP
jgi:hypothetical protein